MLSRLAIPGVEKVPHTGRAIGAAALGALLAALLTRGAAASDLDLLRPGNAIQLAVNEDGPSDDDRADSDTAADFPGAGLLSEFHKQRKRLKELGISFSVHERSEVWANTTGGGKQGTSYNGLTTAKVDVNLETLTGGAWAGGEFYASGFEIHGHGPSRSLVGNNQLVSNIEATPSVKLYDLWYDQTLLDKKVSIRFGQEGANDEVMTTAYSGLFINSSFGFPGIPAAVLPEGGPNYPLAAPFVRGLYFLSDTVTLLAAAYTDDPAPPGGNPQVRDRNGTDFRLNGHKIGFGEVWYSPDTDASANLPTTYKLGAWYANGQFADQRFDNAGGLLASPTSTGVAQPHAGDWALYGIVDQKIWTNPQSKDRGVGVFAQVMGSPGGRNVSNLFIETGMNWYGPFDSRTDDVFGVAMSYLGISQSARQYSNDLIAFGQATRGYASNETVIEATYSAPITGWLTLQPDVQYVINPNFGQPNNFGPGPFPNALVIGLRATFRL